MSSVDPDLLSIAAELVEPGDTVWDVGANIGLFSFAAAVAAGASGRVLALEPDTELVRLLRKSARTNHDIAPVEILPAALMDEVGVGRFNIARRNRSTSHLDGFGTSQTGGVRSTELVPTVTLDWLADHFPLPRVLKIDVEAAELAVLRGGARVLSSSPTVICEVAGNNAVSVGNLLSSYGYTLYDAHQSYGGRIPTTVAPAETLAICEGSSSITQNVEGYSIQS